MDEVARHASVYVQDMDLAAHADYNWVRACHSDHLLGQWWAHSLGLGHVLDRDHARSAANAIFRYNFRETFQGFHQNPRLFVTDFDQSLLVCT